MCSLGMHTEAWNQSWLTISVFQLSSNCIPPLPYLWFVGGNRWFFKQCYHKLLKFRAETECELLESPTVDYSGIFGNLFQWEGGCSCLNLVVGEFQLSPDTYLSYATDLGFTLERYAKMRVIGKISVCFTKVNWRGKFQLETRE